MADRDDPTPPDAAAAPAIAEQLAGNGFRFHHIGVIVRDLATAGETYRLLGFGPGHEEEVASQGVRVLLLPTDQQDQYIELFAPIARRFAHAVIWRNAARASIISPSRWTIFAPRSNSCAQ